MNEDSLLRAMSASDAERVVHRLKGEIEKSQGNASFWESHEAPSQIRYGEMIAERNAECERFVSLAEQALTSMKPAGDATTSQRWMEFQGQLDRHWNEILRKWRGIVEYKDSLAFLADRAQEARRQLQVASERLGRVRDIRSQLSTERPPSPMMLRPDLAHEVDRLKAVLDRLGLTFETADPSTAIEVEWAETDTGITFNDDITALWIVVGGSRECNSFVTDIDYHGYRLCTLDEGLYEWSSTEEFFFEKDEVGPVEIQPHFRRHPGWFPIAETVSRDLLFFDAAPTSKGKYGQIIEYSREPESVYLVADSFIEMFQRSNDILEALLRKNSDYLSDIFSMLND